MILISMYGTRMYFGSRPRDGRCPAFQKENENRSVSSSQAAFAAVAGLTLALDSMVAPLQAQAVLNSPNAQIARTVDAALRRSTPAFNAQVKEVQDRLENIQFQLRIPQRKPWYACSLQCHTGMVWPCSNSQLVLETHMHSSPA